MENTEIEKKIVNIELKVERIHTFIESMYMKMNTDNLNKKIDDVKEMLSSNNTI